MYYYYILLLCFENKSESRHLQTVFKCMTTLSIEQNSSRLSVCVHSSSWVYFNWLYEVNCVLEAAAGSGFPSIKYIHCKQNRKLQIIENNQQVFQPKYVRVDLFWSNKKENSLRSEEFLLFPLSDSCRQRLYWFINSVALQKMCYFMFVWKKYSFL